MSTRLIHVTWPLHITQSREAPELGTLSTGWWVDGHRRRPAISQGLTDGVSVIIHDDASSRLVLLGKRAGHPEVIHEFR